MKNTANTAALHTHYPYVIQKWQFFIPYSIVLLAIIFMGANALFNWNAQAVLPTDPQKVFLLGIIFENPHIIASNLQFFDKEYLQFYRKQLIIRVSAVILVSALLVAAFGTLAFFAFFYGWTIYHVTRQQVGMGRMLNRQPSRIYELWGWLFLATSLVIAVAIGYFGSSANILPAFNVQVVLLGLVIVTTLLAIISAWRIKQTAGRLYICANACLLFGSALAFQQGMPLLAILLPRVVHDLSAFLIYINHDTNRNTPTPKHILYRVTARYMPIWLALISFAVLWGAVVTYAGFGWLVWVAITLTLLHYCTEAFMWKRDSIHRRSVKIA